MLDVVESMHACCSVVAEAVAQTVVRSNPRSDNDCAKPLIFSLILHQLNELLC